MGVFIQISFDDRQITPALSSRLVQLCPVDVFEGESGELVVSPDREDECTLCELCLKAVPVGVLKIHKLYNGKTLISSGDV